MGISTVTALEIFGNPNDLEISVWKGGNEKFSIMISRGPKHFLKPLLSAQSCAGSLDEAVGLVRTTLEQIQLGVIEKLGGDFDQSEVLTPDLIVRITEELRQHKVASTYKMLAATGTQSA